MRKTIKLTPSLLKRIVIEERKKLSETLETGATDPEDVEAEEVDASDQAKTLTHDVDYLKVLKIAEVKLIRRVKKIREAKMRLKKRIIKRL